MHERSSHEQLRLSCESLNCVRNRSGNVIEQFNPKNTHPHTIMPSASSPASSGVSMTTVFLFFAVAAAGVAEATLTHIPITHNSAGSIAAWGPIDVWACGWGCTSPQTHAHGIQVMTGLKPNQWYLSQEDPIIPSGSSSAIVVATGTFGERCAYACAHADPSCMVHGDWWRVQQ